MDEFLARTLERLNKEGDDVLRELKGEFIQSMRNNCELFGRHAFRRSLATGKGKRSVINLALFDVFSWVFTKIPRRRIDEDGNQIRKIIIKLIADPIFKEAITHSTNSTKPVKERFDMVEQALGPYMTGRKFEFR